MADWTEHVDPGCGRTYYFQASTGTTSCVPLSGEELGWHNRSASDLRHRSPSLRLSAVDPICGHRRSTIARKPVMRDRRIWQSVNTPVCRHCFVFADGIHQRGLEARQQTLLQLGVSSTGRRQLVYNVEYDGAHQVNPRCRAHFFMTLQRSCSIQAPGAATTSTPQRMRRAGTRPRGL